jgi:hypothetical protein
VLAFGVMLGAAAVVAVAAAWMALVAVRRRAGEQRRQPSVGLAAADSLHDVRGSSEELRD